MIKFKLAKLQTTGSKNSTIQQAKFLWGGNSKFGGLSCQKPPIFMVFASNNIEIPFSCVSRFI